MFQAAEYPDPSTAAHALASLPAILTFLEPVLDIAEGRVTAEAPPQWLIKRGWFEFLACITEDQLALAEVDFAGWLSRADNVPESLLSLAQGASAVTRLPALAMAPVEAIASSPRWVKERKHSQIVALLGHLDSLATHSERVVDVGAGMGHFSRLSAEAWDVQALGLDRQSAQLTKAGARTDNPRVRYAHADLLHAPLELSATDLVVGLHACGEITDIALAQAVAANARVAFVGCCLQKQRASMRTFSSHAAASRTLSLSKASLGLSNLSPRSTGVEVSQIESIAAREARHTLRLLLLARGISVEPGQEMAGVNRRQARKGLASLARAAFLARRMPEPAASELAEVAARGAEEYAQIRRWSLPRALLARVIECAVACDRAEALRDAGYNVTVAEAFPVNISPRNIVILGAPHPAACASPNLARYSS